jgi:hypothetical protein
VTAGYGNDGGALALHATAEHKTALTPTLIVDVHYRRRKSPEPGR